MGGWRLFGTALLLIGFAGAFRRCELVALNVEDIEETAEGLRITIRRSKTDREGHGQVVAIPRGQLACPVAALRACLETAGTTEGPVFHPIAKGGRIQAARLTLAASLTSRRRAAPGSTRSYLPVTRCGQAS